MMATHMDLPADERLLREQVERLQAELAERDVDWILAIGHALGLDSGYYVPVVPEVQAFKNLFAEIQKQAMIAAQEKG